MLLLRNPIFPPVPDQGRHAGSTLPPHSNAPNSSWRPQPAQRPDPDYRQRRHGGALRFRFIPHYERTRRAHQPYHGWSSKWNHRIFRSRTSHGRNAPYAYERRVCARRSNIVREWFGFSLCTGILELTPPGSSASPKAMSGKKPFHSKTIAFTIVVIFQNIEPQPEDHPNLPENDPLWALLHQCWSPVPTNRPTAAQMIERLERFMAGN